MAAQLTPEQVKNWREFLCTQFGPYALIAPEWEIQEMRDRYQGAIDSMDVPEMPSITDIDTRRPFRRPVKIAEIPEPQSAMALALRKAGLTEKGE